MNVSCLSTINSGKDVIHEVEHYFGVAKEDTPFGARSNGKKRKTDRDSEIYNAINDEAEYHNKKRKIGRPLQSSSQSNLRGRRISTGENMAQTSNDNEIPLVPMPKRVAVSHPDYFSIILPYARTGTIVTGTSGSFFERGYRLNDIFDPEVSALFSGQPLGRDTWASIYDYYRVVQTDMKITFYNSSTTSSALCGYELTDDPTNLTTTREAFLQRKNNHHTYVTPGGKGIDYTVKQFTYRPEKWDLHITQESKDTFWTPVGSSPSIPHLLYIRAINGQSGNTIEMEYMVEMKFHVQFREVNSVVMNSTD